MNRHPALVVCMGVSGCGKTTVARAVAAETGLRYLEADDFHSEQNRARMASGKALDDSMRAPWIEDICRALITEREAGRDCVLACSALRKSHRDRFRATGFRTLFLFLDGDRDRVARWMAQRKDHFMPTSLLDSQFEALESPLDEADVTPVALSDDWSGITETAVTAAKTFLARQNPPV